MILVVSHSADHVPNSVSVSMNKPTNVFLLAAEWDNKVFFKGLLRERPDVWFFFDSSLSTTLPYRPIGEWIEAG